MSAFKIFIHGYTRNTLVSFFLSDSTILSVLKTTFIFAKPIEEECSSQLTKARMEDFQAAIMVTDFSREPFRLHAIGRSTWKKFGLIFFSFEAHSSRCSRRI